MTSKQVNVSVTILSISGLHVKDTAVKKKSGVLRGISPSRAFPSRSLSPARRKKGINLDVDTQSCAPSTTSSSNNITDNSNETTVVASFTRMAKKKKRMTHVGSIPLQLSSDNYDCGADVLWPVDDTSMQQKEDSSHYRFLHTFDQHEESNDPSLSSRLLSTQQQKEEQEAPQTIQIAISRQARMFKLGTASIPLSADTRSGTSIHTLPITNCNPIKNKKNGVNKPMMMKLKDDTIKVSMDTDATIKIRVAVEPTIGETVTISERFNVTMITDSMMKQKEMHDLKMKEEQMKEMSLQDEVVAVEKKEQQPTLLEDVSTTTTAPSSPGSTAQIIDDAMPMIRVLSHPDDEQDDPQEDTEETQDVEDYEEDDDDDDDDEASCSSSAYMSEVPSKYQGHNLSVRRSNSTTTTDMSSVVSDLTEGCSFLSQNGIEVVPFNTTPNDAKLSSNPNINTMLIDSKEDIQDRQPNLNSTQSRTESEDTHLVDPSVPVPKSSSFPHRASAENSKRQTWRERFSCVGLNSSLLMCGENDGNDISETLSSVIEEDIVSTNKYSLANLGRCHNPLSIPSASYYTDDGSFVEDDEDSDDDNESSSSSESSGGRDERYTALEGALFG